ncbi:hypothetical protein BDN67DRAFT_7312 [Paxillus ammoniavirescens]|nr:hypothetical protein BDN67DRAFT_7312 [Paxillus ammoniavirescens]
MPTAININDTSPLYSYSPYYDGVGLENGWEIWYSGSGFNSTTPASLSSGYTSHITSLPGASVSLDFYGSAITLYGIANCTFDVTLDGNYYHNLSPNGDGSLFAMNLTQTNHSITLAPILSAGSGQQLAFQSSEILLDPPDGEPLAFESISSTNTTVFKYEGGWATDNNPEVPGSVYRYANTSGSTVSLTLSNVSIVVLRGFLDVGFGTFSVSFNGTEGNFNGSTNWFLPVVSLYYQSGLDPLETYSLEVMTTSPGGFGLQSVSLYLSPET